MAAMSMVIAEIIALVCGIALIWAVVRYRRSIRKSVGLASVLLGFGAVVDPPARQGIEATESERDDGDAESGEPK